MSAIHQPSPAATPLPERISPQAVAPPLPEKPSRKGIWLGIATALAILAMAGAWYATNRSSPATVAYAGLRTVKVTVGPAVRIMRVGGSTAARNFASLTAPMMRGPDSGRALVLISLAKSGSIVKKGEFIAQIDAQSIKDHVDDINSQVQQAESDIKKRKAEQAIEMENLRQGLRVAKSDLEKAKLDAGAADIRTDIDKEILRLAVEEADATYKELSINLATSAQMQKSEIKILEYTRDRHTRHRDRHRHDVERFTMHAPIGGLVVMESIWRGGDMGQIEQGDQVSPGQPFMKIVDPNSMQLEATINQAESDGIRIGQTAELHFDAFPDLKLKGKVYSVGAMGVQGWRQNYYIRTIPVRISILEHDPRVIPDLSASADVVLGSRDKAILVPLEALQSDNGKNVVFVKQGDEFKEKAVEVGLRNNTEAAVIAGLQPGEEVALGRPATVSP
ncbi:MAG: HlyD family efflux transporter periplasmic adaptor subunit [Acidobacteriota bacterium]|nr:HlyD family efflux transporter periplasmic adaptor subunit [Acidobacteriota bacterium]